MRFRARCGRCAPRSGSRRRGCPRGAAARPGGAMSRYRIAVVGATGAVGTVMLQCLKERGLDRSNEIVLFATARSAGKVIDGRTVRALDDDADLQGIDIALFSAGGGTSLEWAPRFVRGRRDRDRQLLGVPPRPGRAAGRLRGQPARAARAPRPDRQPELLDDAADGRARADPPRGRHRAAGRLDLPVGFGHGSEGDRGARGRGPRRARRASRCRTPGSTRSRSRST